MIGHDYGKETQFVDSSSSHLPLRRGRGRFQQRRCHCAFGMPQRRARKNFAAAAALVVLAAAALFLVAVLLFARLFFFLVVVAFLFSFSRRLNIALVRSLPTGLGRRRLGCAARVPPGLRSRCVRIHRLGRHLTSYIAKYRVKVNIYVLLQRFLFVCFSLKGPRVIHHSSVAVHGATSFPLSSQSSFL